MKNQSLSHINRMKGEKPHNHFHWCKKKKAFDKVQTCFHNKNTQQNRNRKARMTTFTTSIKHSTRSSRQSSLARKRNKRTSLEVQWLRFWDSTTGDTVSTPAQRTKIPHPRQHSQDFFFFMQRKEKKERHPSWKESSIIISISR